VGSWCRARAAGTQRERPGGSGRPAPRRVTLALAVLRDGERVLLERRPAGGLLGGMWALPEREIEAAPPAAAAEADSARPGGGAAPRAVLAVAAALGARPRGRPDPLAAYEHRFTHLHATYLPCVLPVEAAGVGGEGLRWVTPGSLTDLALPVTQRRILGDVAERYRHGAEPRIRLSGGG
jgi:A/G-specific adenine glycosylase